MGETMVNRKLVALLGLLALPASSPPGVAGDINPNVPDAQGGPTTYVLMHNRMGVRIEYDLTRQALELWISPQAGKSLDVFDRNFSNRDDHTRLFDRIAFPGLSLGRFRSCRYDPFHSVLSYDGQVMHVLSLYDQPALLIWFEKEESVDIKADKTDTVLARDERRFHVQHPDRGYVFDFVARIADGGGRFQHQIALAKGRSTYARAHLVPGEALVIGGEIEKEKIGQVVESLSGQTADALVADTEAKAARTLARGVVRIRGNPDLQTFFDLNKRSLLAEMDASGQLKASIKKVGCLPYMRDGAFAFSNAAYAGWTHPLAKWNEFVLSNPTVVADEEPRGRMWGQLVGPITKWEEDGVFYAIWSAFSWWSQTGDRRFSQRGFLSAMEDATDWLERYCWDEKRGLFGRFYYTETAFRGSRDDGWDNAIGCPSTMWPPDKYEGREIARSYDVFINMAGYDNYLMLASMTDSEEKARRYLEKAKGIEGRMSSFVREGLPDYGMLLTTGGEELAAGPYAIARNDYIWGLTVPPLHPRLLEYVPVREALFKDMMASPAGHYAATYYSLIRSMDPIFHGEPKLLDAIEQLARRYYPPGPYMPMPYTIGEQAIIDPGDYYTDIRPMPFPTGPMMAAISGLGLRKLPYGIAVRGSAALESIRSYEYQGRLVDVRFEGLGEVEKVLVNGRALANTYQIPESTLTEGANEVVVRMGPRQRSDDTLVTSTCALLGMDERRGVVGYALRAYGKNLLVFERLSRHATVRDARGQAVEVSTRTWGPFTEIEFEGRGEFGVRLE
jgi:hypothetical protein